jgi:hypothetical protein
VYFHATQDTEKPTAKQPPVAAALVHARNGFFMNWTGQQKGEGIEYHLLAIALAIVVLVKGAGAISGDRAISGSDTAEAANLCVDPRGNLFQSNTRLPTQAFLPIADRNIGGLRPSGRCLQG